MTMKTRTFLPIVAVLFAAFALPIQTFAQTLPRSTNFSRSTKLRSYLAGGSGNLIASNTTAAFLGGGQLNKVSGDQAFIGGGAQNEATGDLSPSVVGGVVNKATASYAFIGGGAFNHATEQYAVVGGGQQNTNSGFYGFVGGGLQNFASSDYSTIPGGYDCQAGRRSFAAGMRAKATHNGSFVWSGDIDEDTASTADGTFTVRCEGGAKFYTGNGTGAGAWLKAGLSSWDVVSDSNAKTKVRPIDPREVLAKLAGLPVSEWEYKSVPQRRFFGPMAQDFHASFGLGDDDKTINTLDADGVLFLSVKGLIEELKERDKEIAELKTKSAEVDVLKKKLQMLEERLDLLPPAR